MRKKGKVFLKIDQKSGFYITDVKALEDVYNKPCDLFKDNGFEIDDFMEYKKESKTLSVYDEKNGRYHRMKNKHNEELFNKINVNDFIYFDDKSIYLEKD